MKHVSERRRTFAPLLRRLFLNVGATEQSSSLRRSVAPTPYRGRTTASEHFAGLVGAGILFKEVPTTETRRSKLLVAF
jgi:hypothetical protein